ncbi:MAG: serine hydrolase domain-containing protein [Oscillospiraceae bacterium]|nr:serine hydrolase domain-containing protein [Oscillospiraceae bacterium]
MEFSKLTNYLDSLKEKGIPSVDCIVYENHNLLYRHMNGEVDATKTVKIQGNEMYLMFSMTKVQTMTAIMQLIEQEKISLEDPVSKYLPSYTNLMVEDQGTIRPTTVELKIKHLLSMQSGLDYNLERPGIIRVLKEKGRQATTRELVDAFTESPLKFEPGEHFLYSLSHDVAAAIIEVVSGMSFGEYLKKYIWAPLQMHHTCFAKPMNDHIPHLAAQYICDEKGITQLMDSSCIYQLSDSYESGGAGLASCTEDYAIFADTLASGGISKDGIRILKPETIEIMKTNLLCDASLRDIANTMGRAGYGYACGVQVLMEPTSIHSLAPAGLFGWDGAAGSCIIMDTISKRSVVYTQHVRNCGLAYEEIHPTLRELVFS